MNNDKKYTDEELRDLDRDKQLYDPDPNAHKNKFGDFTIDPHEVKATQEEFEKMKSWPTGDVPEKIQKVADMMFLMGGIESYISFKAMYLKKDPKDLLKEYMENK